MLEAIIRVLAPHYCLGCGREDTLLCDSCRLSGLRTIPSRCYRCKTLTTDAAVCKKCRSEGPLRHIWASCEYEDLPKQLIHKLKFERAKAAHKPIAIQIDDTLPVLTGVTISHVPTATSRVRQRGYDQSRLVARELSRLRSLPYRSLLLRRGQQRQVGAERSVRVTQAQDFFAAKEQRDPLPTHVLLVDDVLTTGATLQAAARCLRRAGVKCVDAVVFAQRQ